MEAKRLVFVVEDRNRGGGDVLMHQVARDDMWLYASTNFAWVSVSIRWTCLSIADTY